jgi:hypothetical protein
MEGALRKAKKALGAGLCLHLPAVAGDREDGASERRASDALSLDSSAAHLVPPPNTPAVTAAAESSALRRSNSGGKSSKVRPFFLPPLIIASPFLSVLVEICAWAWFVGIWVKREDPCSADAKCRVGGGRDGAVFCFWLGLGTDWSNAIAPVNDLAADAVLLLEAGKFWMSVSVGMFLPASGFLVCI